MLLRRITEHVENQNWFAVGVDLSIVVVGVFIGIQVSSWNDARVAAVAESRLMVRLANDMQILEAELIEDAENYALTVVATGALLTALRADAPPADERLFQRALWRANHYYEIPSLSATYAELVASGGLSRISNHEIRAALVKYSDSYYRSSTLYSVGFSVIVDPDSHYYNAVEWAANPMLWADPQTAIVSYDWNALQSAKTELQAWLVYQSDIERDIRDTHQAVQKILVLLEN